MESAGNGGAAHRFFFSLVPRNYPGVLLGLALLSALWRAAMMAPIELSWVAHDEKIRLHRRPINYFDSPCDSRQRAGGPDFLSHCPITWDTAN